MPDKPRLSIDIYNQYVKNENSISWPDDPNEKALLARALFGRQLIACFDYWIRQSIEFIENPESEKQFPRHNRVYQEDRYFRTNLKTLDPKQKQVVRDLVRKIGSGILFSFLVSLDQANFGKYDLRLTPSSEASPPSISLFSGLTDDLHDELYDWILSFSEFSAEIVEIIQHPQGWWQFQPKDYWGS